MCFFKVVAFNDSVLHRLHVLASAQIIGEWWRASFMLIAHINQLGLIARALPWLTASEGIKWAWNMCTSPCLDISCLPTFTAKDACCVNTSPIVPDICNLENPSGWQHSQQPPHCRLSLLVCHFRLQTPTWICQNFLGRNIYNSVKNKWLGILVPRNLLR